MLTALLNTTVIWLSSLLLYELLLKRETFHWLNRFYLLLTFLAGICLPLLPWGDAVHFTISSLEAQPAPSLETNAGGAVLNKIASPKEAFPQQTNWLMLFYAGGVGVSSLYLFTDLFKLWRLFRRSRIHRKDGWIIAETGREQCPFSFLRILFVCRQTDYTSLQWQMVLQHETAHYRRKHIFDLALLQVAQILIWFHPLVYMYRQKLRLLHEYEVDALQEQDIGEYGRFLLQQATVSTDYSLTHAFNFSPLKNRIQMLTKKPSIRTAKWRFLVLLPLMSLFLWCCSQNRSNTVIDLKGEYAMRHNLSLEYPKELEKDTVLMNVEGREQEVVFTKTEPAPVSLDRQKIATRDELRTTPQCVSPGGNFGMEYLLEKAHMKPILEKMNDGSYFMSVSDIIVDSAGRIAYYKLTLPQQEGGVPVLDTLPFTDPELTRRHGIAEVLQKEDKTELQKNISEFLLGGEVAFTPAKNKQGKEVPYFLDFENGISGFQLRTIFTVKDHKLVGLKTNM